MDSFLYSQGLNSQAIVSNAKDAQYKAEGALNTAQPSVNSALRTITSTSPNVLAQYALGLVAFYYLVSPVGCMLLHAHSSPRDSLSAWITACLLVCMLLKNGKACMYSANR